ncbi:uncharacterized protein METZ01_LOCUS185420, partial [marine metagenome]
MFEIFDDESQKNISFFGQNFFSRCPKMGQSHRPNQLNTFTVVCLHANNGVAAGRKPRLVAFIC